MSDHAATDEFAGRVALVTGASSGMGRAIALALGGRGARVGVAYRSNDAAAAKVVAAIRSSGGEATPLRADVSSGVDVERMFGALAEAFGPRVDMLVNNAGDWMDKVSLDQCPEELWDRMMAVNAKSVFLCCRAALRRMIPQRSGAIVNIGSVAGHTGGGGGTVPYAAAKGAVHTLTHGLAREVGPHGIRVNAVSPGMIDTPMIAGRVTAPAREQLAAATPLGRFGTPEDVVQLVLLLLGAGGDYITGQVIEVNGGLLMR